MAVRLRWWESLLLVAPVAVAVLFLVGGYVMAGTVLLALIVILVATRAQITERALAGGYATTRGILLWVKVAALAAIYVVIVTLLWVAERDDWNIDTRGSTAVYALGGLAFFIAREVLRLERDADNWLRGGGQEKKVGRVLDNLRESGWVVSHDLLREPGRNVDHFVVGPRGAFVIETKSGRSSAAGRGQAVSNAVWAKEKFGQRWVTAVLCVGTDPPVEPHEHGYAWVLGVGQLEAFLRGRG